MSQDLFIAFVIFCIIALLGMLYMKHINAKALDEIDRTERQASFMKKVEHFKF